MKASKKFFLALSMLVGVSAASCAQLVIEPPDPNSSTPTTNTSGGVRNKSKKSTSISTRMSKLSSRSSFPAGMRTRGR